MTTKDLQVKTLKNQKRQPTMTPQELKEIMNGVAGEMVENLKRETSKKK